MANSPNDQDKNGEQQVNLKAIFSGPSYFANRSFATRQPLGLRLTFMESNLELKEDHYRAAVFLQLPDAIALRDLLNRVLEDVKIEIEEQK